MTARLRWLTFAGLVGMVAFVCSDLVKANTPSPQFHIGRLWNSPEYDGAEGWGNSCWNYPGGIHKNGGAGDENEIKRGWIGQGQKWGTYMFSKNWTDPQTTPVTWDDAASYFFRSMNYNYPTQYTATDESGNMNYLYGVSVQEYLRWERPIVSISTKSATTGDDTSLSVKFFPGEEGLDSVVYKLPDNGGVLARPTPVVQADLVSEEMINMVWRYIMGVEYSRNQYAYAYGSPHQDYRLEDITLTNNGISGNVPDAPVLTGQTINKMVWAQAFDSRTGSAAGKQQGRDQHAAYIEPWGAGNHAAVMIWDGDEAVDNLGPDFGDPAEDEFYQGQLLGNAYQLIGPIFTSAGPGADVATDDPAQPPFRMVYYERGIDIAGQPYSPPKNDAAPTGATDQREFLTMGSFQLAIDQDYQADDSPTQAVAETDQGPTAIMGYGKVGTTPIDGMGDSPDDHGWDLAFGESVRIVQVAAGGGISEAEGHRIGAAWFAKKTAGDDPSTWMSAEDQALVQTGRDTAMKAAALAYWNFTGALPTNVTATELAAWGISDLINPKPAGHGEFDVPDAPRPPGGIYVRAKAAWGMEVRWTKEAEAAPNHDTGVADMVGYRVYRQAASRNAQWELVAEGPAWNYLEAAADGDIPAGRYYRDTKTTPGVDYWYSVTAYNDGSQNWARPGKALESTRWWTWTGYSYLGVAAEEWGVSVAAATPGELSLAQNAPNPFNPTTSIQFAVPATGDAKLVVYNMAGQVVRTLVNGTVTAGVHTVSWDSKDAVGRNVASGVYVYRLTSGTKQLVKRMTLVR